MQEWRNEWEMVMKMASPARQTRNPHALPYQSLEEFHVFMMANILRRPIIVMAQPSWHDLDGNSLQFQNFRGVYLPLKWQPEECCKQPIILGYYQMHFVPLVYTGVMDGEVSATEYALPLINRDHTPMEVHFLCEEEMGKEDELLQRYLILEDIPHMDINESMASAHVIRGAQLSADTIPDEMNLMVSYFKLVETHYRFYLETEYNPQGAAGGVRVADKKSGAEVTKLEEKMPKLDLEQRSAANMEQRPKVNMEQPSDMWTPASNPNYKSNIPTSMQQAYTPASREGAMPPREGAMPLIEGGLNELSPIERSITEHPQVIHSLINQGCATEGCQYYRSVSTGKHCHECYNKIKATTPSTTKPSVKSDAAPMKCRTEGCFNVSVPGQSDHCQVCLDSAKFKGNIGSSRTSPSAPLPSNIGLPASQQHGFSATTTSSSPQHEATITASPPPANLYQSAQISSNTSDDDLTTLMVNTVRVGSKKCIMPECQLTGHPKTNDMCQKCFEENRRIHQNVMAETAGKLMDTVSVNQAQQGSEGIYQQRKPCRTSGCNGLGNPHLHGYCTQCEIKTEIEPQPVTAMPPFVSPPDYSQAMKIIQGKIPPQKSGYATAPTNPAVLTNPGPNQINPNPPRINPGPNPGPIRQGITVPKHICTTPGCSGIRLDGGYCWECVRKNNLVLDPPRTRTPPPTPRQSWISPDPRPQTPPLVATASHRQQSPTNPPYGYPTRNQAAPANRQYQTTNPSSLSTRVCRHPKCDRPAAPPKYILCEECIRVAELLYQPEEGSNEQHGSQHNTQALISGGTATPWNEKQQPRRNPGKKELP